MILHYIKIALRNIAKYKTQNFISIISIAVGIMFFTGVWSGVESALPTYSLKESPNYERMYVVTFNEEDNKNSNGFFEENAILLSAEQYSLMNTGNITCAEQITGSMENGSRHHEFSITADSASAHVIKYSCSDILVTPDYLTESYARSAVTGNIIAPLDSNECVISESLAQHVFGTTDVIGRQINKSRAEWLNFSSSTYFNNEFAITVTDPNGKHVKNPPLYTIVWFDNDITYTIADVKAPSGKEERSKDHKRIYTTSNKTIAYDHFYVTLKEGFSQQELTDQLKTLITNKLISVEHLPTLIKNNERADRIWAAYIYAVCLIILIGAAVGYLRMQIQLFGIRKHEIALRISLGATNLNMWGLLITEVICLLVLTGIFSLLFCTILKDYLTVNLSHHLSQVFWPMTDFATKNSIVFTAVAALLIAALSGALVFFLRRNNLSSRMRPKRSHIARNAAIGLQLTITSLLICYSIALTINQNVINLQYGINTGKANSEHLSNCFMVPKIWLIETNEDSPTYNCAKTLEQNDNIVNVTMIHKSSTDLYPRNVEPPFKVSYVLQPTGGRYLESLGVDYTLFPNHELFADEPTAIVCDSLYARMQTDTLLSPDYLSIKHYYWSRKSRGTKNFRVIGTYHTLPYVHCSSPTAVLNLPSLDNDTDNPYQILAECRPGYANRIIDDILETMPENFKDRYITTSRSDETISSYTELNDHSIADDLVKYNIALLLTIINVISSGAALYSTIQLDTRRRQKEVALRKINGATGFSIAKIFARNYLILLSVCFVACIPLCIYISSTVDLGTSPLLQTLKCFGLTAIAITLVTALTIGFHIRRIMRINPAEIIKTE